MTMRREREGMCSYTARRGGPYSPPLLYHTGQLLALQISIWQIQMRVRLTLRQRKICTPHVASRNRGQPGARYVVPAAPRGIKCQAAETLNTQFLQTQLHSKYMWDAAGRCVLRVSEGERVVAKSNAKSDRQLSPRPAIPKFCAAAPRGAEGYFKILLFLSMYVYCSFEGLLSCWDKQLLSCLDLNT
jgi:hypothetical protein